jgi:hypothetical protein
MGRNEKLTVTSSATGAVAGMAITVDNGTATLGDLSALGAITVSAPHVRLQQRAAGQVIRASNPDDPITDAGLDLISGQSTVTLNTPDLAFVDAGPSDAAPKRVTIGYFGPTAPTVPATLGNQLRIQQLATAYTPADLLLGPAVLDLGIAARPTPAPTPTVDPSIAIAGATHPFLILPPDDLGFATFVWDQLHDDTVAARRSTNAGPLTTPPTTMPATRPAASTASAAARSDDRE